MKGPTTNNTESFSQAGRRGEGEVEVEVILVLVLVGRIGTLNRKGRGGKERVQERRKARERVSVVMVPDVPLLIKDGWFAWLLTGWRTSNAILICAIIMCTQRLNNGEEGWPTWFFRPDLPLTSTLPTSHVANSSNVNTLSSRSHQDIQKGSENPYSNNRIHGQLPTICMTVEFDLNIIYIKNTNQIIKKEKRGREDFEEELGKFLIFLIRVFKVDRSKWKIKGKAKKVWFDGYPNDESAILKGSSVPQRSTNCLVLHELGRSATEEGLGGFLTFTVPSLTPLFAPATSPLALCTCHVSRP
ncbi:hypothetical protein M0802_008067 [Mischocyttarus mexicanus]|nr:hypothetical protein M0802_008067 [Mischocyttarus mexicanus]